MTFQREDGAFDIEPHLRRPALDCQSRNCRDDGLPLTRNRHCLIGIERWGWAMQISAF